MCVWVEKFKLRKLESKFSNSRTLWVEWGKEDQVRSERKAKGRGHNDKGF